MNINKSCNHIIGLSSDKNKKFVFQSDEEFPSDMFIYCCVCGTKINWEYMSRKILFK